MCRRMAFAGLSGVAGGDRAGNFGMCAAGLLQVLYVEGLELDVPLEHVVQSREDQVIEGVAGGLGDEQVEVDEPAVVSSPPRWPA